MQDQIVPTLSFLTLLSNIVVFGLLALYVTRGLTKNLGGYWKSVEKLILKYSLALVILFSGVAVAGSLLFSEVVQFTPCKLCWYQRIFMYPIPLLAAVALIKKTKDVYYYIFTLAVLGLGVATYHYAMQMSPTSFAPCTTIGYSVSCAERFFASYGYITIPWMSLSMFVYIALISLLHLSKAGRVAK